MLTHEENNLLTRVGPGTPCGEFLRRYWQPVALSEELPPGGPPLPIKLLGEELVLFRDDRGRLGLLGRRCSHRGTDLSYGRIEDGGLRCIYHGWLYDIYGNCLEQPGEPGGGEHRASIRHPSHSCRELGEVIFAYVGPGEPPLLPKYEFLNVPGDHRFVSKIFHDCNYLQSNEGNIDPVHLSFLHRNLEETEVDHNRVVRGASTSPNELFGKDVAPTIEVELTDFGLRIYTVRNAGPGHLYLRVSNFVFPNLSSFPGQTGGEGYSVNWHVPIDDTAHWKYTFVFSRERPLQKEVIARARSEMAPGYRLVRQKANRYLQDRGSMKTKSYTGIGFGFQNHDAFATESQGPIQDRTREHLVSSDRAIVAARKLMVKAINDIQQGQEAPHVIRDAKLNRFPHLVVISEVIPSSINWKEYTRKLEAKLEAKEKVGPYQSQ